MKETYLIFLHFYLAYSTYLIIDYAFSFALNRYNMYKDLWRHSVKRISIKSELFASVRDVCNFCLSLFFSML